MNFGKALKNLTSFGQKTELPKLDINVIQGELSDQFFGLLNKTFEQQQSDVQNSLLNVKDIDKMTAGYANKNMLIAAASGMVPGPLGIFSAVPDLVLSMGNQMSMIYDFSCAFDKESFLNKDLLLDIPIFALGGKTNLAAIQDQSNLLDSPDELLKGKALDLGKGMIERNLKKSLVKFIPVGGSLVMAIWAKTSTNKIAKSSRIFFDDNQHFEDVKKELPDSLRSQPLVEKIKAMINLMEADGEIHESEVKFIAPVINNTDISDSQKARLLDEASKPNSSLEVQLSLFRSYPEEVENLVMELCILAKRDGKVHPDQRRYLMEIIQTLEFEEKEMDELLAL